jgi:hypothetical protein
MLARNTLLYLIIFGAVALIGIIAGWVIPWLLK